MCQDCFWQGKTADNHSTDHEVKEYITNVCTSSFIAQIVTACIPNSNNEICMNIINTEIEWKGFSRFFPEVLQMCAREIQKDAQISGPA